MKEFSVILGSIRNDLVAKSVVNYHKIAKAWITAHVDFKRCTRHASPESFQAHLPAPPVGGNVFFQAVRFPYCRSGLFSNFSSAEREATSHWARSCVIRFKSLMSSMNLLQHLLLRTRRILLHQQFILFSRHHNLILLHRLLKRR